MDLKIYDRRNGQSESFIEMNRASQFSKRLALLFSLMLIGFSQTAWAQSNIQWTVQDKWPVSSSGYYRVKFEILDLVKALPQDRTFQIVATPNYGQACVSKKSVTLPAGANQIEDEILIPLTSDMGPITVFIDTNRNLVRDFNELHYCDLDFSNATGTQTRVLYVDNAINAPQQSVVTVQAKRRISRQINYNFQDSKIADIGFLRGIYGSLSANLINLQEPDCHAIPTKDLPDSWVALSSIDLLVIPESELDNVFATQKTQYKAIRDWVAYGGSLLVFRGHKDFKNANRLRARICDSATPSWHVSRHTRRGLTTTQIGELKLPDDFQSSETLKPHVDSIQNGAPLLFHYGLGNVMLSNDDLKSNSNSKSKIRNVPFPRVRREPGMDRTHVLREQTQAYTIPGIGKPPIAIFQLLIVIFVIVVGPVTFSILKYQKRIALMYIVVPIISFLTCTGLVGFSLLYEGISIRGRIVSYTELDSETGVAVTTAAHSFYSVFQPSGYAIEDPVLVRLLRAKDNWQIQSKDGTVEFSAGNARSRAVHQLETVVVHRPAQGLSTSVSENGNLIVTNRFNQTIEGGVIRRGEIFYTIPSLESNETLTISTDSADTFSKFADLCSEINSPQVIYSESNSYYRSRSWRNGMEESRSLSRLELLGKFVSYSGRRNIRSGQYLVALRNWDEIKEFDKAVKYKSKFNVVLGTFE